MQVLSNLEFRAYLSGLHQAFTLKILKYLAGPVASKDEHEDDDDDPEDSSDQGLVAEEDVDDALDGRVLRVVLDDLAGALKFFVLLLLFWNQAPSCNRDERDNKSRRQCFDILVAIFIPSKWQQIQST